jgi:hypothetical protein
MASSLDKLKALTSRLDEKIEEKEKKNLKVSSPVQEVKISEKKHTKKTEINTDNVRNENIIRVKQLYEKLKIFEKSPDFDQVFIYKAMNISGIGLKEGIFRLLPLRMSQIKMVKRKRKISL